MASGRKALKLAIFMAGGASKLSRQLGISKQAVAQWWEVPPIRVLAVEAASGISRHDLRPDIYPRERQDAEKAA